VKAVIPAAGLGTRFLPYTKAQPKEMLPVLDKPAIQYVVEEAVDSGLRDILIVTGRGKRAIEDHFDRSVELESYLRKFAKGRELEQTLSVGNLANIMYVRQKEPLGLGHAVMCAEPYVGEEPFSLLLGDDICFDAVPCTKQLIQVSEKRNAAVLAVQEIPKSKVSSYGVVIGKALGHDIYKIEDIVEKPKSGEVDSNLATIGRYVLMPKVFKILGSTKPGVGGEIQLTDAIRSLIRTEDVYALNFRGKRYDIGDKATWLRANVEMAMARPDYRGELKGLVNEKAIR
jgi:UTP--glucose-1-phosphate uridylyltransferase